MQGCKDKQDARRKRKVSGVKMFEKRFSASGHVGKNPKV
jgi:hypothetical protein